MYTLGEAAGASGKSKPTIAKAIKSGRISAARAEDGSYCIDPAELHRVYPMTGQSTGNGLQSDTPADTGSADMGLRGELDKWRTLAVEREETIRDLRARLGGEFEERRRLLAAAAVVAKVVKVRVGVTSWPGFGIGPQQPSFGRALCVAVAYIGSPQSIVGAWTSTT